jgi:hypothetical protein
VFRKDIFFSLRVILLSLCLRLGTRIMHSLDFLLCYRIFFILMTRRSFFSRLRPVFFFPIITI